MNTEARKLCEQLMNIRDEDMNSKSYPVEELEKDTPYTVNVSCSAVADNKSNGTQTLVRKNIKNKFTTTQPINLMSIDSSEIGGKSHSCDIHAVITLNLSTITSQDNKLGAVSADVSNVKLIRSKGTECTGGYKTVNKCICTYKECVIKQASADICTYSCKYGCYGPCCRFSLGTAAYRNVQREICNTMLIGGCRVKIRSLK